MSRPLSCRFFFKTFLQLSINRANFIALQPPFRVVNPSIQTHFYMVGVLGFEPRTSSLSWTRSNQLSYTPGFPQKVASRRPRASGPLRGFGYFSGAPLYGIPCVAPATDSCLRVRFFAHRSQKVASRRPRASGPLRTFGYFSGAPLCGIPCVAPRKRLPFLPGSTFSYGGAEGIRTLNILLAKQAL